MITYSMTNEEVLKEYKLFLEKTDEIIEQDLLQNSNRYKILWKKHGKGIVPVKHFKFTVNGNVFFTWVNIANFSGRASRRRGINYSCITYTFVLSPGGKKLVYSFNDSFDVDKHGEVSTRLTIITFTPHFFKRYFERGLGREDLENFNFEEVADLYIKRRLLNVTLITLSQPLYEKYEHRLAPGDYLIQGVCGDNGVVLGWFDASKNFYRFNTFLTTDMLYESQEDSIGGGGVARAINEEFEKVRMERIMNKNYERARIHRL